LIVVVSTIKLKEFHCKPSIVALECLTPKDDSIDKVSGPQVIS